ncbi:MAG TPA: SDR family oxidoreductase [Candidatus Saccharimonadales bacterium]|nr:SDR family oxidoreductase [Candidatus Saccharimonadales bacterium]
MKVLIIGGSSGLGLALSKEFSNKGDEVIITGRNDPKVNFAEFRKFDLTQNDLPTKIERFIKGLPKVNVLVYAAGFYQDGTVTDLSTQQIEDMLDVGGRGLIYFVRSLLIKQNHLDELVTVTSTSQWTPRKLEPIYNFIKAGAGQLSNGLAEDGRIAKVLVAAPSGMRTAFWDGVKRDDLDQMLDKGWVAQQIIKARSGKYQYKFIQILRQPARVEVAETR